MGLGIFGSSGSSAEKWSGSMAMDGGSAVGLTPQPPEPNPKKFQILEVHEVNGWTVAIVHYPGCTTYGGRKCLVFDCGANVVQDQAVLDPHFLERSDMLSPIARFEATKRGTALAKNLCKVR